MAVVNRGILGGTFDPPHIGHLIIAEEARLKVPLDRVTFIPTGEPWRKAGRRISAAEDRLAMVRRAIADNPRFDCADLEVRRAGPTYTVDTLRALHQPGEDLYLILGADALRDLPNWHRPADIAQLARIVVVGRPGWEDVETAAGVAMVEGLAERLVLLNTPLIDVSATDLRARARRGESLRYLVPDAVATYIQERDLYPSGSTDTL